jgi:hypothetical protein
MEESDIYTRAEPPDHSRSPLRAVSQRRDAYLRATGGESVHRHHRHHHHHHHHHEQLSPPAGSKIVLPGLLGLIVLLAGALWWLLSR